MGPADLHEVAFHQHLMKVGGHLAVVDALNPEVDLAGSAGWGRDAVAALGLVAVLRRQPDVVVLTRPMRTPRRQRQGEGGHTRRLLMTGTQRADLPDQRLDHPRPQSPV